MGFGFNLLFMFFILPVSIIFLIIWIISGNKFFLNTIKFVAVCIVGLIFFVSLIKIFTDKKEIEKDDIFGEYIIDNSKFSGKQSDWQYDHFRFEITIENNFMFYVTDKEKIIKTYDGTVEFHSSYKRPRIIIHMDDKTHHIIESKPTLYRTVWGFYYVFYSPKFGNVFFKKGHWKNKFEN